MSQPPKFNDRNISSFPEFLSDFKGMSVCMREILVRPETDLSCRSEYPETTAKYPTLIVEIPRLTHRQYH